MFRYGKQSAIFVESALGLTDPINCGNQGSRKKFNCSPMIPDQRTLRQWRFVAIVLGLGILSFQIGCSTLTGLRDNSSRLSLGNNALEARQLTRNGNLNCQTGELRKAELNQREAIRKNENDPWLWERLAPHSKKEW